MVIYLDDSQWIKTPLYIPNYHELRTTPSSHIHLDSLAAWLSLTLEELALVLQQQLEFLQDEYAQPPTELTTYRGTPIKYSQPLPNLKPNIHPQPSTIQLGLTPDETREVHKEYIHTQQAIQEEMET
jgi:hypothetical protein